jgi:poly(A) polymerase
MQPRFERRTGKSPYKVLEHLRWRAGYDFLLLRCASGEIDAEIGEWWTEFADADGPGREALLTRATPAGSSPGTGKKRTRRRGGKGRRKESDAHPDGEPNP